MIETLRRHVYNTLQGQSRRADCIRPKRGRVLGGGRHFDTIPQTVSHPFHHMTEKSRAPTRCLLPLK